MSIKINEMRFARLESSSHSINKYRGSEKRWSIEPTYTLHPHLQEYRLLDNKGSKNEIFKSFSHPELDGNLRI